MAQNIRINVSTPGAPQAIQQIDRLGAELTQAGAAAQKLGTQATQSSREVARLAAATPAAAGGTRNMGLAALEASRAFEDAQYGIRGVLNNIPSLVMMLGGSAGIAGAASIAAVAISTLAPKLQGLFGGGSEKDIEAVAEALGKLREKAAAAAAERGTAAAESFIDSLDDEEAAITAQNQALERNLQLLSAKRRAEVESVSAQAALDLAKIDASDMSEADKIRARAGVQGRVDRASAQAKLDELGERVGRADQSAAGAAGAAERAAADEAAARDRLARETAERDALRRRKAAAGVGASSAEGIRQQIADTERQQVMDVAGEGGISDAEMERFRRRREELDAQLAEAERQAQGFGGGDRKRLAELEGAGGKPGSIASLEASVQDLAKAAADLQAAAAKSAADAAATRDVATVEAGAVIDTWQKRREAANITTGARAGSAARQAAERTAAEQRQRDLAAKEAEFARTAGEAGGMFSRAGEVAGRRGFDAAGATMSSIGGTLANGTNAAEIQQIGKAFENAVQGNTSATVQALRAVIARLDAQSRELETLRGQIKTNRRD